MPHLYLALVQNLYDPKTGEDYYMLDRFMDRKEVATEADPLQSFSSALAVLHHANQQPADVMFPDTANLNINHRHYELTAVLATSNTQALSLIHSGLRAKHARELETAKNLQAAQDARTQRALAKKAALAKKLGIPLADLPARKDAPVEAPVPLPPPLVLPTLSDFAQRPGAVPVVIAIVAYDGFTFTREARAQLEEETPPQDILYLSATQHEEITESLRALLREDADDDEATPVIVSLVVPPDDRPRTTWAHLEKLHTSTTYKTQQRQAAKKKAQQHRAPKTQSATAKLLKEAAALDIDTEKLQEILKNRTSRNPDDSTAA